MVGIMTGMLAALCYVFVGCMMRAVRKGKHKTGAAYKAAASACFVAVGFLMATRCTDAGMARCIVAGLICGMAGDILLELGSWYFAAGIGAFAAGHILYCIPLLQSSGGLLPMALVYTAAAFGAILYLAHRYRMDAGALQIPGYLYMALVAFMGGATFAYGVQHPSLGGLLMALGGTSFVASDVLLCLYHFGTVWDFRVSWACMVTYEAAQLLIAFAMGLL